MSGMNNKGLGKFTEEVGEALQVAGKIMAVGCDIDATHWDGGPDLRQRLEEELADVEASIAFLKYKFSLNDAAMHKRRVHKLALFLQWDAE